MRISGMNLFVITFFPFFLSTSSPSLSKFYTKNTVQSSKRTSSSICARHLTISQLGTVIIYCRLQNFASCTDYNFKGGYVSIAGLLYWLPHARHGSTITCRPLVLHVYSTYTLSRRIKLSNSSKEFTQCKWITFVNLRIN